MTSENGSTEVADELLAKLCRGLSDENKFARKACLGKIRSALTERAPEDLPRAFEVVFKDVLRCFSDPSEACREQSILLVTDFLVKLPSVQPFLTFVFTLMVKRIGLDEGREPSEENRLLLLKLLAAVLAKSGDDCNLLPHFDELNKILCRSLLDDFPEAKLASCQCTKLLAAALPKNFHVQSESYVKALIAGAVHKHNKIRTAFISTIGTVILFGTHNLVEKVAPLLGERLYDANPSVRKEVVTVGGEWLVRLPDRYSQFCRIIPLVVTGLDDEMPDVRETAQIQWDRAGEQYELENEDELKNELDYGLTALADYPLQEPRPRIGCRSLMQRESSKMIPAILKEMHDWSAGVRMQSASLLYQLVRHLEAKNIQYLQKFWPDLCLKCADADEYHLKKKSEQTVRLLGYFAPAGALLPVALSQDELTRSQLCCLAAALEGMVLLEEPHILQVCQALAKANNTNMELPYQSALLESAKQTLFAARRSKKTIASGSSLALFTVLLNLKGNSQSAELSAISTDLLENLAAASGLSQNQLYKQHGQATLAPLLATVSIWTEHCAHKNIFAAFVHGSGTGIGPMLPMVAEIIISWAKVASTAVDLADMLKVAMPILSWKFLVSCNVDPEPFLKSILFDAIQPNLKWSAGRVAEVRRSQALVLLTIIVSEAEVSDEIISSLVPNFPPLLTAMLEESSKDPRLCAGRVLEILCRRWKKIEAINDETSFKIIKVAGERLDDVKADVRIQALRVLKAALPLKVPPEYSSHLESLFKTTLIHLDDQDKNYSAAVLDTLKVIGAVDVPLLKKLLCLCRKHFNNQEICDELLRHFQQ